MTSTNSICRDLWSATTPVVALFPSTVSIQILSAAVCAENSEVERGRMLSDKYDRYLLTGFNNKLKKRRA